MVTIDENKPRGLAPPFLQCILKTAWFHILILILVLANAIVAVTMSFDYRKHDPHKDFEGYYYVEVSYCCLIILVICFTLINAIFIS